ncbi:hypothetical protein [Desulfonema ishimotonii]|uniref:hypothetical protein n=1 Tax=Desulfonema ishimotonii TaxID=45657 RepID=UPI000F55E010|nr:hypothetical protein [Desulfonema ishimotonii]
MLPNRLFGVKRFPGTPPGKLLFAIIRSAVIEKRSQNIRLGRQRKERHITLRALSLTSPHSTPVG